MSLRDTIKEMKELLHNITSDVDKAEGGNKAASQRVRTGTVKLEKVAKLYRKESIHSEKQPRAKKASHAKKPAKHHAKPKAHAHHTSHGHAHHGHKTAKVKAKPKAAIAKARPRMLSMKRPTAKLPTRHHHMSMR